MSRKKKYRKNLKQFNLKNFKSLKDKNYVKSLR